MDAADQRQQDVAAGVDVDMVERQVLFLEGVDAQRVAGPDPIVLHHRDRVGGKEARRRHASLLSSRRLGTARHQGERGEREETGAVHDYPPAVTMGASKWRGAATGAGSRAALRIAHNAAKTVESASVRSG